MPAGLSHTSLTLHASAGSLARTLGLMYSITSADRPREVTSTPQSSVGAPCPMLLAGEHVLSLAFYLEESRLAPPWSDTWIRPEESGDSDDLCAVVTFSRPYAHMFGPPNDEAFSGHPLAARGLKPYSVFEVENSSWVHSLERMNSVHPYHRPERFVLLKHFIYSFYDSTFECVAEAFSISLRRGSVLLVLQATANEA